MIIKELTERFEIDSDKVNDVFERISLLVHGICTVIATSTMEYSNDHVIKIVNEALNDAKKK